MPIDKSKRKLSTMQFVSTAADIFMLTSKTMIGLPKRWYYPRTSFITNEAYSILKFAVSANCIYVKNEHDFAERRRNVLKAIESCTILQYLMDT